MMFGRNSFSISNLAIEYRDGTARVSDRRNDVSEKQFFHFDFEKIPSIAFRRSEGEGEGKDCGSQALALVKIMIQRS